MDEQKNDNERDPSTASRSPSPARGGSRGRRPARWRAGFLCGLERTGQVREAAKMAGVDFTTAYQARKRDADFAEAWEAALRRRAERAEAEDEAELVKQSPLPPTAAPRVPPSPAEGRGASDGKSANGRWSAGAERRFFAALAATANVRAAALAAGFSTTAVYQRRAKRPGFARDWDRAVEAGKARLQMHLIHAAERTFDPEGAEDELGAAAPAVSAGDAIRILKTREGKERERQKSWAEEEAERMSADDIAEVRERLLNKLERLRQREMPRLIAEGWSRDGDYLIPPGWVRDPDHAPPEDEPER